MSVTPHEILGSAEVLAAIDTSEVHQRNAISRAYYAAYHRSCEFIKPDGKDRGVGSHRSYIEQLQDSAPGSLSRKLGVCLGVVYTGRIKSDYKIGETVVPKDFSVMLGRAKDIFKLLDEKQQQPANLIALPIKNCRTE